MAAIVVGPYTVDASKCTEEHHVCVHDWRIAGPPGVRSINGKPDQFWDNVPKTGDLNSDAQ